MRERERAREEAQSYLLTPPQTILIAIQRTESLKDQERSKLAAHDKKIE